MNLQIELTNKCNTQCIFCPRDKTPITGYMEPRVFYKTIERVLEFKKQNPDHPEKICICGLGEPFLHQDIIEFVSYLTKNNVYSSITSNGHLVDPIMAEKLINSGLKEMCFSVSGIDDMYQTIQKFDFSVIRNNILNFKKLANDKCNILISITKCKYNKSHIKQLQEYWISEGINGIIIWDENNRGGAHNNEKSFINSDIYKVETEQLLKNKKIRPICFTPFLDFFIGWNGNYYMCCNDFEKQYPLGSVFDYDIKKMYEIKRNMYEKRLSICEKCDNDPINLLRAMLMEIDNKTSTEEDLNALIKHLECDSRNIYGE